MTDREKALAKLASLRRSNTPRSKRWRNTGYLIMTAGTLFVAGAVVLASR